MKNQLRDFITDKELLEEAEEAIKKEFGSFKLSETILPPLFRIYIAGKRAGISYSQKIANELIKKTKLNRNDKQT